MRGDLKTLCPCSLEIYLFVDIMSIKYLKWTPCPYAWYFSPMDTNTIAIVSDGASRSQNARGAATCARICGVASELFFEQGFNSVTMEEIAKAAGIRRSTLYLHYRDKDAVLGGVAESYLAKLRLVYARLPKPAPTREEIEVWVAEFADFATRERASTELLISLSHMPNAPKAAFELGEAVKLLMAERLSAFRRALEPGQPLALAWGLSTVDGLGWALCHYARDGKTELSQSRLTVAAAMLNRFVRGEL